MEKLIGKFIINPDILICNYGSRCIFSCNGYIEFSESGDITVTATDFNDPLITGTDWELESAECIVDNIWKICLSRGPDTIDTLAERKEKEDFENNC